MLKSLKSIIFHGQVLCFGDFWEDFGVRSLEIPGTPGPPGLLGDIDAREDLGRLGDARETLRQRLRGKVIQVQVDVVLERSVRDFFPRTF